MIWLESLTPWQALAFSGTFAIVGLCTTVWICALVFKRMDEMPEDVPTEDQLRERRSKAAFKAYTTEQKLKEMK